MERFRLYELDLPIDTNSIDLKNLKTLHDQLTNLQGNILQGHGRNHCMCIFLRFKKGKEEAVIKTIKRLPITSAQQQRQEAAWYRDYEIPGRLFMSFCLSAMGYEYLGFEIKEGTNDQPGFDREAFHYGAKAAQGALSDPEVKQWDKGYQRDIHAMILIADNDELTLLRRAGVLLNRFKACAEVCTIERGQRIRNPQGNTVEHFGFVDGRSQPLFFQSEIDRENREKGGSYAWNSVGPNLVLVPDPYGQHLDHNELNYSGSYLVFRKLEQNVLDFKEKQKKLAKALAEASNPSRNVTEEDEKRAGALVIGRFADGTPVVLSDSANRSPTSGSPDPVINDFTYENDPEGLKCPFQAHIRKVNPRTESEKDVRIVRRGITYGKREGLEGSPTRDVGLLFMCYQNDIESKFERLQRRWANAPNHPKKQTGIDPIIGQGGEGNAEEQKWPIKWNDRSEIPFDFYGSVTLKGGEYFFVPSIYFLKYIDQIKQRGNKTCLEHKV